MTDKGFIHYLDNNLGCSIQRREGWYFKSCRQEGIPLKKQCRDCKFISELAIRLEVENEQA